MFASVANGNVVGRIGQRVFCRELVRHNVPQAGNPTDRTILGLTAIQGAVTVIGDLLGWASDSVWPWWGTSTSSGRDEVRSDVLALTVRATCLAAIGVVLGLWRRRTLVLAVSAAGVAVALVVGLGSSWLAAEDGPDRPPWEDDGPRGCVELSGEPSDCP